MFVRSGKLHIVCLTYCILAECTCFATTESLWSALPITRPRNLVISSHPLLAQVNPTRALAISTVPSSLFLKGLWTTQSALQWSSDSVQWLCAMYTSIAPGWTDVSLCGSRNWTVSERATVAVAIEGSAHGAAGFAWNTSCMASAGMQLQVSDMWAVAATVRNAIGVGTAIVPSDNAEVRIAVGCQMPEATAALDVISSARYGVAMLLSVATALANEIAAGVALRTSPSSARLWFATPVDVSVGIVAGADIVSKVGWRPFVAIVIAV